MTWKPTTSAKPAPWAPRSLGDIYADAVKQHSAGAGPKPLERYRTDPTGFFVDILGIGRETIAWSANPEYATHEWDGTKDPLLTAFQSIANGEWIAVASGTGTGKTFGAAGLILWHLACWRDSVTVTVATKEDQMAKGVWREIARLWPAFQRAFPQAELTHLRIRMEPARGDAWAAWAVTSKVGANETSATGVQGLHAERLLILVDETPGVPQAIMTALVNTATDEKNIIAAWGNPDHQADPLAMFGRYAGVKRIRISALDHPNVVTGRTLIPGAASRKSVQQRADEYGVDSPMYGSRVRGIAPEQAEDALIKRAWVMAAVAKYEAFHERAQRSRWPIAYGVDPSNSDSGDLAAVARFEGPLCTGVEASRCPDANVLGTTVWMQAKGEGVSPEHIGVDSIGVGAGTANEINRLAPQFCRGLNSGSAPIMRVSLGDDGEGWFADANQFLNLRAQMYWQAREDLRTGRVAMPNDAELIEELVAPTYAVKAGKVVIEPKDDIRARLGRSPNKSDAFVYGNWVRPRSLPPSQTPLPRDRDLGMIKKDGKMRPATPSDRFWREHVDAVKPPENTWWRGW